MFLRTSTQRCSDGSTLTHFQIAESYWDPTRKRSRTRIIHNCGRGDDAATVKRLRGLARSILLRCSPPALASDGQDWKLVDAWPYGDVYVLEQLWERLGIPAAIKRVLMGRRLSFDVERALFAMVANRACAPCSKLYCWEQWLREDVQIRGTERLALQRLYRAMDVLEANKDELEREVFFSVSSLLNLDVELVFYDTTSLHLEIDEPDQGVGEEVTGWDQNSRCEDLPPLMQQVTDLRSGREPRVGSGAPARAAPQRRDGERERTGDPAIEPPRLRRPGSPRRASAR